MASTLPGKFPFPLGLEICLLVSYFRTMWVNAVDEVVDAILGLGEELTEIVKEKRRKLGRKCRKWIARRGITWGIKLSVS